MTNGKNNNIINKNNKQNERGIWRKYVVSDRRLRLDFYLLLLCWIFAVLLVTYGHKLCWSSVNLVNYLPYVIGYFFAVFTGTFSINLFRRPAMNFLWDTEENLKKSSMSSNKQQAPKNGGKGKDPLLFLVGDILGAVERIAYIISFLSGWPHFIAVWVGVKVAISFRRYEERFSGREMFNVFVLNSLLSVGYAFAGWKLIEWCSHPYYKWQALWLILIVPTTCLGLLGWLLWNMSANKINSQE